MSQISTGGGGGGSWGSITGTLSSQTDLQSALDAKVGTTGAESIAGVKTFSSNPILSALTASKIILTDGSKALASSSYAESDLAILTGRSGGQILTGSTAASEGIKVRSTSNSTKGLIELAYDGGNITIGGAATASELRFLEPSGSGTNYTSFKAQAQAGDITYTLPPANVTNGYLKNDGSGGLTWSTVAVSPAGSDTYVQFNDGGSFGGEANFLYDKTTALLTLKRPSTPTHYVTMAEEAQGVFAFRHSNVNAGTYHTYKFYAGNAAEAVGLSLCGASDSTNFRIAVLGSGDGANVQGGLYFYDSSSAWPNNSRTVNCDPTGGWMYCANDTTVTRNAGFTVMGYPAVTSGVGVPGTVTTTGTTDVTGTSTKFRSYMGYGDRISNDGGTTYSTVRSIASDTALVTQEALPTLTGQSYRRKRAIFRVDNSSGTPQFLISDAGNIVCGWAALATNATDGFVYVPTCAGAATGTPSAYTGTCAMVYDTTNNKLYVYNGAWKSVTLA